MLGDPYSPRGGVAGQVVRATPEEQLPGIAEPEFMFAQDNASTHTTKVLQLWLKEWAGAIGVGLVDWPAYSPDLNPIENLWKLLKERVNDTHPELAGFPSNDQTKQRLCGAAVEAWENNEDGVLKSLKDSMPRRLQTVREAKGWLLGGFVVARKCSYRASGSSARLVSQQI